MKIIETNKKQWILRQIILLVIMAALVVIYYLLSRSYTGFLSEPMLYHRSFILFLIYAVIPKNLKSINAIWLIDFMITVLIFCCAIFFASYFLTLYRDFINEIVNSTNKADFIEYFGIEAYQAFKSELVGLYGVFTSTLIISRIVIMKFLEQPCKRYFSRKMAVCKDCGQIYFN